MKYLLDSNVVSEPIRANPRSEVVRKMATHQGEMCIAAPVWHELRFGSARLPKSKRREDLDRFFEESVRANLPVFDYDLKAANWHAYERARLAAAGLSCSYVDGQIAAIAHVNDLTLVTFNLRHFERFAGLRVESWA